MAPSEQDVFDEALAIGDARERASYLARACQGDESLRSRVESLIAAYLNGEFLETPADSVGDVGRAWREASLVGKSVGKYAVLELLGEGGMGDVYLARRMGGDRQSVALKVIKPGMDSRQVIARFELERTALAKMDHPHIAQFLEAGVTEQGRAYFAMELVQGLPITSYCDRQRLHVTQRLKLMVDLCLAVQHAHSKGLVHRDLKPSNVLVTEIDGDPIVKVIDFGVAKALDQELSDRTIFTRASQVIGTPLYMSPEQVRWCPNVDIRSDVYSLGVLLYELLSGAPPFDQETLNKVGFKEFQRIIQEDDPVAPSYRIASQSPGIQATLAATHRVSPKQLRMQVRGDLDWIALKALAKDPARRYANPGELAEDLDRYLTHRTISARAPRLVTRARKWVRRHPHAYWSVFTVLTAATILVGAWRLGRMVEDARTAADAAAEKARHFEYGSDIQMAWAAALTGDTRRAMGILEKHKPPPGQPEDVGFEWHYLRSLNPRPIQVWQGHQAIVLTADVSPDDRWIASGDRAGTVLIWDPATGRQLHAIQVDDQEVTTVKFSPNGKWLATSGMDRVIHIWNTGTWDEARQLRKHERTVCAVAWSPDGERLASGCRGGDVHLWEAATGRHLRTLRNNVDVVRCVAWSPDGRHLVSGNGSAGGVNVWDATTWQLKASHLAAAHGAQAIAFSDDGRWMAFGGYGGLLIVVNLDEPEREIVRETAEQIWSLAFLAGDRFAVGMGHGSIEVVRLNRDLWTLERQWLATIDGPGTHRAILPVISQHRVVLASEEDQALKLMSGAAIWGCHVEPLNGTPLGTAAGNLLYVDRSSRIVVRNGLFGPTKATLGDSAWRFCLCVRSAATGLVAVGESFVPGKDIMIRVYDSSDWRLRTEFRPTSVPLEMSFSKDGRFLVGGADDGKIWVYDLATDQRRELHQHRCMWNAAVAFSPTEDFLVLGACGQHTLKLLSVPAFEQITSVETQSWIKSLAIHPDGSRVAVGEDGSISIREFPSLRAIQVLRGHPAEVFAVAFSQNGRTLASAGLDGIRLWDVATGREFFTIGSVRPGRELRWLQFVDATTLLAGNGSTWDFYQYGEPLDPGNR